MALTNAELVDLSPTQLSQDYQAGLISPAEMRDLITKAASYDLADLVARALTLVEWQPGLFEQIYQTALTWLQRNSPEMYQVVTRYYYTLPQSTQADIAAELTRRGLVVPQVATSSYQPDLTCNMTYENIQPGQGYTQCTFKNPHTFSLAADQIYFAGPRGRQCPYCFQPVPKKVHYQGLPGASKTVESNQVSNLPTVPVSGTKQYKRPGRKTTYAPIVV